MANVQLNAGTGGPFVATNPVTRDAVTEQMELINIADPSSAACAPVDAVKGLTVQVGAPLPTGGNNIGNVNIGNQWGPGQNQTASGVFNPITDSMAVISITGNGTTQIIAGVAGKQIRVTHFNWIANSSGTVQFVQGAGNTVVSGAYPVTAETGESVGDGTGAVMILGVGNNLSITAALGATIFGFIAYTVY